MSIKTLLIKGIASLKTIMLRGNIFVYMVFIIALIVVVLSFYRLYFGVDFTDEAFYIVMSYRFAIGAVPFVDEINLLQTASLIITPFVKIYYSLMGSTEGIVLFTRRLYLVYTILLAAFVFWNFRKFIKLPIALLISLFAVTFIPYSVPNFSYNTLSYSLFALGCITGAGIIINNYKLYYFILSGLFHGLAVLVYPTVLIPAMFFLLVMVFTRKTKAFMYYGLGGILVAVVLLPYLIQAGWDNLLGVYAYICSFEAQGGDFNKIIKSLLALWYLYPYKTIIAAILAVLYISYRLNFKPVVYILALIVPILPLLPVVKANYIGASLLYVAYFALIAPYILLFIEKEKNTRLVFWALWMPSLIAGLTYAWSSSNGYVAAGLGLFTGSLVTAYFTYILLSEPPICNHCFSRIMQIISPAFVLLILIYFQYACVYRDDPIAALNTRVIAGPYRGMVTSVEKNDYLTVLSKDLASLSRPELKVLFYDRFPAGYLLTSMQPATNTCWLQPVNTFPKLDRQIIIDYYNEYMMQPDIVVKMNRVFYSQQETNILIYPQNDNLNNMVEDNNKYEELIATENYSIFQKVIY